MARTEESPSLAERSAAVAALVTVVAASVVILVGVAENLGPVLITFIGILVAVVGAWHALAHRGAPRVIAMVVALAGAGLLVGGIVSADFNGFRIAAVLVLAVLSLATARFALHRSFGELQAEASAGESVSARHPVLIMNPKSGGGKAERFRLVDECNRRGIEPIVLQPGDDLLQLAENAIARGADVIGMAGGDGSQALVATVAIRHDVPHVVVPAGTRNHFALDLGLNRDDVVGALDAYSDGVERRIDLAKVNGRVFVNNATMGLYAKIVQSPEYRDAKRQTATAMLPELIGPNAVALDLRFAGPDGAGHATAHVILVSNDPYELDRIVGRGTRARLDLGVLGVAAAILNNAADAAQFMALETAGQLRRFPGLIEWTDARFEVESSGPVEVGVDGEALVMDPPLVFESMPGALRVWLPRRRVGLSPAAKAVHLLSRSTIVSLTDVARGRAAVR
jgi:diacylglycerol kinase family enzyme